MSETQFEHGLGLSFKCDDAVRVPCQTHFIVEIIEHATLISRCKFVQTLFHILLNYMVIEDFHDRVGRMGDPFIYRSKQGNGIIKHHKVWRLCHLLHPLYLIASEWEWNGLLPLEHQNSPWR